VITSTVLSAADLPLCSTEKTNGDCSVSIDRDYPITLPTFRMRPGSHVHVVVLHSLPFESLSLDVQSAQALPPSDQVAGLVSAIAPNLKGLNVAFMTLAPPPPVHAESPEIQAVERDLRELAKLLADAKTAIDSFLYDARIIYAQLQEVAAPLPRPGAGDGAVLRHPVIAELAPDTPDPWKHYADWRGWLICEFAGAGCDDLGAPDYRALDEALSLQLNLTPADQTKPLDVPLFKRNQFSALAATTRRDIDRLSASDRQTYLDRLRSIEAREQQFVVSIPALAASVSAIEKDFQSYYVNITETAATSARETGDLGVISDPAVPGSPLEKLFGRQVAFTVNALNAVTNANTSIVASSQKVALATVTVVYGDPIFEVSAGVLFSALPDTSFSNSTIVVQGANAIPIPGNVVISQSVVRPTIVPFAAANFRLGHDFLYPDLRRGAAYLTVAVGFNPYTNTADYAFGPSISWRSLMISPLLHIGHDTRLTQGEYIGQVWCNSTATTGDVPACSGEPPSPSTETHWKAAFALGVSVRVPTTFGGGSQ
jgi:hypothetical protein